MISLDLMHLSLHSCFLFFLDAPTQPAVKEEVISRASSEQGEEEMEVESADEQEEDARSQSGQTNSQVSRSNSTGATFNTLSTLGSLRPGIYDTHYHHSTYLKGLSSQEHLWQFIGIVIAVEFFCVLCNKEHQCLWFWYLENRCSVLHLSLCCVSLTALVLCPKHTSCIVCCLHSITRS